MLCSENPLPQRFDAFIAYLAPLLGDCYPYPKNDVTRTLPTFFLMMHDPAQHVAVATKDFSRLASKLVTGRLVDPGKFDFQQYARCLDLAKALRAQMDAWSWQPRDMIDVLIFTWAADEM